MLGRVSVFVSHNSQDNIFTQRLVADLRSAGVDVWVDAEGINQGDIAQRINDAFIGRQWLILVMTTASLRSPWVQAEVNATLVRINQGKMAGFIPVIAGPIRDEEVPALWAPFHRIDAQVDYASALQEILTSLGVIQGQYVEPGVVVVQPYSADNTANPDPYPLATALQDAKPGDRIVLLPGLYRDQLVIDKPVEILGRGEPQDIIVAPLGADSIRVSAERVRFSNLTIWIGSPTDPEAVKRSISVDKRASVANIAALGAAALFSGGVALGTLLGRFSANPGLQAQAAYQMGQVQRNWNKAVGDLRAAFESGDVRPTIQIAQGAQLFVETCTIRNSIGHGLNAEGELHVARSMVVGCRHCGVVGRASGSIELEDVEVGYNGEDGIHIGGNAQARVKNCRVMHSRYGVAVVENGSGSFDGNTLSNNQLGAWNIAPNCAPNVRQGHFVA